METYKDLGSKYLKQNRRRSFITVLGCFIVSTILFMFLNSMVCWVENCREEAREEDDFEILVLTDDKDTIEAVVNEDFVSSAYLGKAYSYQTEEEASGVYANALHINVKQKLLINHYSKYIKKTYNVDVELNDLLAWTYCQDNEGVGYLMLLGGLLISFILAIIGVGVLRNNISISAMERVKDYGNLRCIGATKKQIRAIVYRESVALETLGIVAGVATGFPLSILICNSEKRQYPIGFHIIPIILLLIAFYGDMYFAVGDGLKKVLAVSPAEAVRGNYRIKAKKIKRRRGGIWRLIFGVEGDYAYKNIKRNNGNFLKTVGALTFGMIIVIVVGGVLLVFYEFYSRTNKMMGYYQQYIACNTNNIFSHEEQKMDLYSPKALKTISEAKGIESPKYMYEDTLYTAENCFIFNNLNETYGGDSIEGSIYIRAGNNLPAEEARKEYRAKGEGLVDYEGRMETDNERREDDSESANLFCSELSLVGYDSEDYARYKDYLVDGTTELSDNGVLLVNQAELIPESSYESQSVFFDTKSFSFTNLKVGDEITVVDPAELYSLVQEEKKRAKEFDDEIHSKRNEWDRNHKDEKDEEGNPLENPYDNYSDIIGTRRKEAWIINSAREKLVEEGKCETYVIEGIIRDDPNAVTTLPSLVVPLDKFFSMTGRTESDYVGMKFHVTNIFSRDFQKTEFQNALREKENYWYEGSEEEGPIYNSFTSSYLEGILNLTEGASVVIYLLLGIIILIIISLLNTMNVTISSLQTRRNEFAQLRALGMTKRSLLKAVLLEGGIVWIVSTIQGIIFGILIQWILYSTLIKFLINSPFKVFWPGIIVAALLSFVVLCGSNYVFFNQMKLNVGEELTRSGE